MPGTATPPATASAPPAITPEKIILPDQRYSLQEIQRLLDIRPATILSTLQVPNHEYFQTHWGGWNESMQVTGKSLLRWIAEQQPAYRITQYAEKVLEQRQYANRKPAEPVAVPQACPLDLALQKAEEWKRDELGGSPEAERDRWTKYVGLLRRADELTADEQRDLAAIICDLDLTSARVQEDLALIRRFERFAERHHRKAEAGAKLVEERAALHALKKRHKDEWEAQTKLFNRAESDNSDCSMAINEMLQLGRKRPLFFEGDPPALIA